MTTEQSDGACTPSFSSAELGGDVDLVATLRKFADIAEAGDKPHWAGAMRLAATEIRNLRDEVERHKNQNEVAKTIISAGVELMPCDKLGKWRGVRTYLEQTAEQYEPFKTTPNA